MMWESLALEKISNALNHVLHTDSASLEQLCQLAGKTLAVKVTHTPIYWLIEFTSYGVQIKKHCSSAHVTVSISGTPSALLRFSKTKSHTQMLMDKTIKIHGDLEMLFELNKIQQHLHIDWESVLAEHIGDFAANRFMQLSKKITTQVAKHLASFKKSTIDFIQHEICFPTRPEVDDFYQQLRDLRRDIETFEKKLHHH